MTLQWDDNYAKFLQRENLDDLLILKPTTHLTYICSYSPFLGNYSLWLTFLDWILSSSISLRNKTRLTHLSFLSSVLLKGSTFWNTLPQSWKLWAPQSSYQLLGSTCIRTEAWVVRASKPKSTESYLWYIFLYILILLLSLIGENLQCWSRNYNLPVETKPSRQPLHK